jgi:hypothetical protein
MNYRESDPSTGPWLWPARRSADIGADERVGELGRRTLHEVELRPLG